MEAFCDKKALEYGITRGTNLAKLQMIVIRENYYYEEVAMKNEDAVGFLKKERDELIARREAMFDRIWNLPIEGAYALDRSSMKIGRQSGVMKEGEKCPAEAGGKIS